MSRPRQDDQVSDSTDEETSTKELELNGLDDEDPRSGLIQRSGPDATGRDSSIEMIDMGEDEEDEKTKEIPSSLSDNAGVGLLAPFAFFLFWVCTMMLLPLIPQMALLLLDENEKKVSKLLARCKLLTFLVALPSTPLLGLLSDRMDKKKWLIVVALLVVCWILTLLFTLLSEWIDLLYLTYLIPVSELGSSLFFGYVSDLSGPSATEKTKSFGLLLGGIGAGMVVAPLSGGLLYAVNPLYPFYAALSLSLIFVLVCFILPNAPPARAGAGPGAGFDRVAGPDPGLVVEGSCSRFDAAKAWLVEASGRLKEAVESISLLYLLLYAMTMFGLQALPDVTVLFFKAEFSWDSRVIGMVLSFVGLCSVFWQAVVIRKLVMILDQHFMLLLCYVLAVVGFLLLGFSRNLIWVLGAGSIVAASTTFAPVIKGLIAKQSTGAQGLTFGVLASLQTASSILASQVYLRLFAVSLDIDFAGSPFILASACYLVCVAFTYVLWRRSNALLPIFLRPASPDVLEP